MQIYVFKGFHAIFTVYSHRSLLSHIGRFLKDIYSTRHCLGFALAIKPKSNSNGSTYILYMDL